MANEISRRRVLKMAGVGAVGPMVLPGLVRGASANSKLNHASIGVDGMGWNDLNQFITHPGVHIAALCDVDRLRWAKAVGKRPDARRYQHWQELLATEGDRIDSVSVTVPDHMHASISMEAMRAGKHVYCQKPLCHDVSEVRAITAASEAAGVITQLGTQKASDMGNRMAVQFMREGVVGKVKRVILCANRPGAIERYRLEGPRPAEAVKAPKELDWNSWLGTAPSRPFAPEIYHPTLWRAWRDFGTGWSGDIGCHIFDAVWKGLGLAAPNSVVAEVQATWAASKERRYDNWPQSDHITWMFPGNNLTETDELSVEWFDGNFFPTAEVRELAGTDNYPGQSAMVIGTEGALLLPHGSAPQLLPRDRYREHPRPTLEPRNHYHHFVDACLGGEKTESHFTQTGPMTEAILLGTVAILTPGQRLEWDAKAMRFPNAPHADQYLGRTYREGWKVKGL